jgi:mRNA interferase RelE/StbE
VPKYRLAFSASARKDIGKLDPITRKRIAKKLLYFLEQDDPLAYSRQLVHSNIGNYRFRVGHYRVVFDINGHDLEVISVKHRKDVYKR